MRTLPVWLLSGAKASNVNVNHENVSKIENPMVQIVISPNLVNNMYFPTSSGIVATNEINADDTMACPVVNNEYRTRPARSVAMGEVRYPWEIWTLKSTENPRTVTTAHDSTIPNSQPNIEATEKHDIMISSMLVVHSVAMIQFWNTTNRSNHTNVTAMIHATTAPPTMAEYESDKGHRSEICNTEQSALPPPSATLSRQYSSKCATCLSQLARSRSASA